MDLVNACMTPRDEVKSYDYTKPIINNVLVGGGIKDAIKKAGKGMSGIGSVVSKAASAASSKAGNAREAYQKKKDIVFAIPVSERSQMRQESYRNFVKFIGFIFYLFYLPLKPWIWIMTETIKKFQKIYAGTIVPL